MIITGVYSFNGGEEFIKRYHLRKYDEVLDIISFIDAETCRLKDPKGRERIRLARIGEEQFYSPMHINALFDYHFLHHDWLLKPRVYTNDRSREGYREMDMLKNGLGIEIQLGKYAFLTYDIVAKMVIYRNLDIIDAGIEICPMASMLPHMSSGIGSFEQVVWDLKHRGAVKGFDVPVIVLGIESEKINMTMPANPMTDNPPILDLERYSTLNAGTLRKIRETGIDI